MSLLTYLSMHETLTVFVDEGILRSGGGFGAVRNSSAMASAMQCKRVLSVSFTQAQG